MHSNGVKLWRVVNTSNSVNFTLTHHNDHRSIEWQPTFSCFLHLSLWTYKEKKSKQIGIELTHKKMSVNYIGRNIVFTIHFPKLLLHPLILVRIDVKPNLWHLTINKQFNGLFLRLLLIFGWCELQKGTSKWRVPVFVRCSMNESFEKWCWNSNNHNIIRENNRMDTEYVERRNFEMTRNTEIKWGESKWFLFHINIYISMCMRSSKFLLFEITGTLIKFRK